MGGGVSNYFMPPERERVSLGYVKKLQAAGHRSIIRDSRAERVNFRS